MRTHYLRLNRYEWDAVKDSEKTFDVRVNDRGFQKGDCVCFCKWDDEKSKYVYTRDNNNGLTEEANVADKMFFEITYVGSAMSGLNWAYVVLGIAPIKPTALNKENVPRQTAIYSANTF